MGDWHIPVSTIIDTADDSELQEKSKTPATSSNSTVRDESAQLLREGFVVVSKGRVGMKTTERRKERIRADVENVKAYLPEESEIGVRIEGFGEGVWDGRAVGLSKPRLFKGLALKHILVR
jgi:hypothetical protein